MISSILNSLHNLITGFETSPFTALMIITLVCGVLSFLFIIYRFIKSLNVFN